MTKSKREIIYERLLPYAEDMFEKINVRMGEYSGNKNCQHVARQKIEENRYETVVACLSFVPNSGVNVHFINGYDTWKGHGYIDNTLGYLSKKNSYFLLKEYSRDEVVEHDLNMNVTLNYWKEVCLTVFTQKEIEKLGIELTDI